MTDKSANQGSSRHFLWRKNTKVTKGLHWLSTMRVKKAWSRISTNDIRRLNVESLGLTRWELTCSKCLVKRKTSSGSTSWIWTCSPTSESCPSQVIAVSTRNLPLDSQLLTSWVEMKFGWSFLMFHDVSFQLFRQNFDVWQRPNDGRVFDQIQANVFFHQKFDECKLICFGTFWWKNHMRWSNVFSIWSFWSTLSFMNPGSIDRLCMMQAAWRPSHNDIWWKFFQAAPSLSLTCSKLSVGMIPYIQHDASVKHGKDCGSSPRRTKKEPRTRSCRKKEHFCPSTSAPAPSSTFHGAKANHLARSNHLRHGVCGRSHIWVAGYGRVWFGFYDFIQQKRREEPNCPMCPPFISWHGIPFVSRAMRCQQNKALSADQFQCGLQSDVQ